MEPESSSPYSQDLPPALVVSQKNPVPILPFCLRSFLINLMVVILLCFQYQQITEYYYGLARSFNTYVGYCIKFLK